MNIGEKIKRLRTEKMMTQAELSGEQVTRNMLSLIEKGKAVPSLQTLKYIASRLNISAATLLADENEEKLLYKSAKISNIKLAYKNHNYRICMELCKSFRDRDDEIDLLLSESAMKIAVEELFLDRIRLACRLIDDAVFYGSRSMYNPKHIEAEAMLLFDYLGELSPSLVSENIDVDIKNTASLEGYCLDNDFFKYILCLKKVEQGEAFEYDFENVAYEKHIECKKLMKSGEYEKAYRILSDILRIEQRLAGVVLYNIFSDLEECCINFGNAKSASGYSLEKVSQLERILSQ